MKHFQPQLKDNYDDVPYEQVNFLWTSDYYDFHREGICKYKNQVCFFTANKDDNDHIIVRIWELTEKERKHWLFHKWLFETFINTYWSYDKPRNLIMKKWKMWVYYRVLQRIFVL